MILRVVDHAIYCLGGRRPYRYDLPGRKSSGMAAYPRITVSPPLWPT